MPDISPEDSKLREIRELERQLAKKKASLGMNHPEGVKEYEPETVEMVQPSPVQRAEYTPGWTQNVQEAARAATKEPRVENRVEKESRFGAMVSTVKTATSGSLAKVDEDKAAEITRDVKAIMTMDEERKIQTLSALAWQKGINYSIEVARKLDDPYVLDLLHAHLSGELHEELVAAKKLDDL
ncbi:MAG: hypothetical protein WC180_03260 [Candidatus Paceibacterota bacterium]